MKYLKTYIKIIRNAQNRQLENDVYQEKHHVFPTSLFGKNDYIIHLTAREHFISHKLLFLIAKKRYGNHHSRTQKMGKAFRMMGTMKTPKLKRKYIITSRDFAIFREINALCSTFNNPAKQDWARKKISESKKGRDRSDLKGKSYFGSQLSQTEIIKRANDVRNKNIQERKRLGKKGINAPSGYKRPHGEDRKKNISIARQKTSDKFRNMTKDEFLNWLIVLRDRGTLYRKTGLGANITTALNYRGENYDEYKEFVEG